MSLINEYRDSDEKIGLLNVPDIKAVVDEVQTAEPQPLPMPPTVEEETANGSAFGSINADGTVGSVGLMQGDIAPNTASYDAIDDTITKQINDSTQAQSQALQQQNNAKAAALYQNPALDTSLTTFNPLYNFGADNSIADDLVENIRNQKTLTPSVNLTPRVSTADTDKNDVPWWQRGLQALGYASNVLQGSLYDAMNLPNNIYTGVGVLKENVQNAAPVPLKNAAGFLVDRIPDLIPGLPLAKKAGAAYNNFANDVKKKYDNPNGFDWTDILLVTNFKTEGSYAVSAARGNDMSISGTDVQNVGQTGKAPIAVANPKLDAPGAWGGFKNPTRYLGYGYDFLAGVATGASIEKSIVSGATNINRVLGKSTAIVINPLGEAVSSAFNMRPKAALPSWSSVRTETIKIQPTPVAKAPEVATVPTVNTNSFVDAEVTTLPKNNYPALKPANVNTNKLPEVLPANVQADILKEIERPKPTASVVSPSLQQVGKQVQADIQARSQQPPTTAIAEIVKVPPKVPDAISVGMPVVTIDGSGKVISIDVERNTLSYATPTNEVKTKSFSDLTKPPEALKVGQPARGGVALPYATETKRTNIQLNNGEVRKATSVRDVQAEVEKTIRDFITTQPAITPNIPKALPPSTVPTSVPGVVTSPASRLRFLEGQKMIGIEVDTKEVEQLTTAAKVTFDDIPTVDSRVLTGAMSYSNISNVVAQQVPGTQIDVGALVQTPRSLDDIVVLSSRLGFDTTGARTTQEAIVLVQKQTANTDLDIDSIVNAYGVPVPTALKNNTDIQLRIQDEVPFKQPTASVVVRQEPIRYNGAVDVLNNDSLNELNAARLEVEDTTSIIKAINSQLTTVSSSLNNTTTRTLETPDIGRRYNPELKIGEPELPKNSTFESAGKEYTNLLHGTRVANLDLTDPVATGSAGELGTGFYLTKNADTAKSYALAEVAPNIPSGAGRQYGAPNVSSYAIDSRAYVLNTNADATADVKNAFSGFLSDAYIKKTKKVNSLFTALASKIAKGMGDAEALEMYRTVNKRLKLAAVQVIENKDTLNVLDTSVLKYNGTQEIDSVDTVLEAVAHRYNVDSKRAVENPGNVQAQVDFEESSIRLMAEMKGKLSIDKEAADLEQLKAITKLVEADNNVNIAKQKQLREVEAAKTETRKAKTKKKLDKLIDPEENNNICMP